MPSDFPDLGALLGGVARQALEEQIKQRFPEIPRAIAAWNGEKLLREYLEREYPQDVAAHPQLNTFLLAHQLLNELLILRQQHHTGE